MTKKAGKLATLAAAAALGTALAGPAMAQDVSVGTTASAGVSVSTGGVTGGATGIVNGLLGTVTGLLGGLNLGGIL